ncbi:PREDICTED: F-box/FBD/LRR-repeat protein At2g26030-like [Erythranthe guttata]|uniref:F-box/FBD/LRR-repeat protein At2g26030-like n=1 Tax=Erythranthe guttata TaxID=4155 RepID=UPI00064D9FC2|nr:PREDICTED: F-box/FBD/LRR-repeat protein At2g26030-like [Erythranthe guttata]|eukprot:XP_012848307.1 PREDICTED: F-box/FBD/LRR-repeat protein At2g26030-like [Erythranthe guttata]
MAIDRNVRSIDLYFVDNRMLPGRILICQTLVDLILENCGSVPNLGSVVYLPCLKKLHLMRVGFEADESLWNLISGCPVLEDLLIKLYVDFRSCKVSSPTVKKARGRSSDNVTILTKQEIIDSLSSVSMTKRFRNLVKLELIGHCWFLSKFHENADNLEILILKEIVDSVLSAWTTKSFNNLTNLELTDHFLLLSKFLENSDNLEFLFLRGADGKKVDWTTEPEEVPRCLISHLRTITLGENIYSKEDLEIVRYLLRNGKVLERMEIACPLFSHCEFTDSMFDGISQFERGSEKCEVVLVFLVICIARPIGY